MKLLSLRTKSFRNLDSVAVSWTPASNLVLGANGAGKSNLLEAVAVLGTLRSFRGASSAEMARAGQPAWSLSGTVESATGCLELEQMVEVGPPMRRRLLLNGRPVTPESYLLVFPAFSVSASDRELVVGSPEQRRNFLDRLAFLLSPVAYAELNLFSRLLRQRNAALVGCVADPELTVWEEQLAQAAATVVARRAATTARLAVTFGEMYSLLRSPDAPALTVEYRAEAWWRGDGGTAGAAERYREQLRLDRERDRTLGSTGKGPHRHDLQLQAARRPLRAFLSSGQIKAVAAALRLAALAEAERACGERLPLIIDEVDDELDPEALRRLIGAVAGDRQLFVASSHGEPVADLLEPTGRVWLRRGRPSGTGCGDPQ